MPQMWVSPLTMTESNSVDSAPGSTFREAARAEARRVWWFQWVGGLLVVGFWWLVPEHVWARFVAGAGAILLLCIYFRARSRVRCPQCGKRLNYLLQDRRMGFFHGSAEATFPISRKGLPDDLSACPYCGFPFDTPRDA